MILIYSRVFFTILTIIYIILFNLILSNLNLLIILQKLKKTKINFNYYRLYLNALTDYYYL